MFQVVYGVRRHPVGVALFASVATFATLIAAAVSVVACTSLATLEASGGPVPLGQPMTLNGRHFATDPALSPIEVRDATTHVLLWSGRPDQNGDFSASIPTGGFALGYHVMVASEVDARGEAVSGTPARVVVSMVSNVQRAQGAGGSAAASAAAAHVFPVAALLAASAGAALVALLGFSVWAVARRCATRARERRAALDMWERSLASDDQNVAATTGDHSRNA
ncbi:MAG: hypothetical protein ACREN2_00915 [Candidatus Dormibacteria bacterium]